MTTPTSEHHLFQKEHPDDHGEPFILTEEDLTRLRQPHCEETLHYVRHYQALIHEAEAELIQRYARDGRYYRTYFARDVIHRLCQKATDAHERDARASAHYREGPNVTTLSPTWRKEFIALVSRQFAERFYGKPHLQTPFQPQHG